MPHPLILQLRFARSEFKRALEGLSDSDARRRLLPMNCLSWNIGHLAWQEQRYWLTRLQGQTPVPQLNELVGYGQPACTPPLAEMWDAWQMVTRLADPFLDTLTTAKLLEKRAFPEWPDDYYTAGTLLQRVIYHYWYHTGENMAIRQMLGHTNLAEFVGDIDAEAPYISEAGGGA
jgi:uncharacterized damage-inducible protein DinB